MIPINKILWSVLFIITFGSLKTNAQITPDKTILGGKILNSSNKEGIPFANIFYQNSKQGTSSDAEGRFSLQLNKEPATDTLCISAIGFKTLKFSTRNVLTQPNQLFYLKEDPIFLETITIKAASAVEVVKRAMNQRSLNYEIHPHILSGLYRITDKENNDYVRLLEAAVDIYDDAFLKKDSRVVNYLALRQSKDFRTYKSEMDNQNSRTLEELLKPDLIKRPTRASHPNGFSKGFTYTHERYTMLNQEEVYVISATKNPAYSWANYNATFYVRVKDLAIIQVERDYNIGRPNWAKSDHTTTRISKDQLILKYKEINSKLYLNYFSWLLKGEIIDEKTNKKIVGFERNEELTIQDVTLGKGKSARKAWNKDIYQMQEPYRQDFWDKYPVTNTRLFQEVTHQLEKREDLSKQFLSTNKTTLAPAPGPTFTIRQLQDDFQLFRTSLEEAHPSLYRYTTKAELSRLLDSTFLTLNNPLDEIQFYQLLTPILAKIRCGHTGANLSETFYKENSQRLSYFPVKVKLAGDKLFVIQNFASNEQLATGEEIISIEGETVPQIKARVYPHLPADGYITTYKDYFFGKDFSNLYRNYIGEKSSFRIRVKTLLGEVVEKELNGISLSEYQAQKAREKEDNTLKMLSPQIALLQVKTFTDLKGKNFKPWVSKSFNTMNRSHVKSLIIDLRDNAGGRDDYAMFLYSFLADKSFSYHQSLEAATDHLSFLQYTDQDNSINILLPQIVHKDSLGRFLLRNSHPTLGLHKKATSGFNGKVFFLINGGTFSAAADFAAVSRQNNKGVFIGEETGGAAAGNTSNGEIVLTLPQSKLRIAIPLFKISNSISPELLGRGVIPEYPISSLNEDIANRKDTALQKAIDLISLPR
ncbi:S41 family peptidase [Adhaeribacter aquaticus]|uniref:S41 family peptidase n=1 Tax=Adhaeribacter aquaticus TaxID=299567 RepID=UPI000414F76B|nr:S41 family peptidase [Adhaeribacter aquaticus]